MQKILDLITIDAARVLGLEADIGSVENGKKADIIFIKKVGVNGDIIADIIHGRKGAWGMILDGKLKIWDNRVLMIDEKKVISSFRTLTNRIKEAVRDEDSIG
jgi:5-methylthioadenosine/S-adenosylhomocysteine deaminase